MKTMTCRQLGGACDKEFRGNTFEEIAVQSKRHARERVEKGDESHIRAMANMQGRMDSPEAMSKWFESKRREFEALPDEKE